MDRQTDVWTRDNSKDHAYAYHFVVKTASNSVNVLLHHLNNTHLLTYCSAQLAQTLSCKHCLQYIGFSVFYALCVTCSYLYSLLLGIIAPRDECSWEHLLHGTKIPGNFCLWERKFPLGTFAPRSKNTGE